MADFHEKKEGNSRTINVEIPFDCFDRMFNMMSRTGGTGRTGSGCCDSKNSQCCPQPEAKEGREFNIVLKVKE